MTPEELQAAHAFSDENRAALEKSAICGCFQCGRVFEPILITKWCDTAQTALCPYCSVDSVIAGNDHPITPAFLCEMRDHWFAASSEDLSSAPGATAEVTSGAAATSGEARPDLASVRVELHYARNRAAMLLRRCRDRNLVIKALSKGAIDFVDKLQPEELVAATPDRELPALMYFHGLARGAMLRAEAAEAELLRTRDWLRVAGRAGMACARDNIKAGRRVHWLRARERWWMQRAEDLAEMYAAAAADAKTGAEIVDEAEQRAQTIEALELLCKIIDAENEGRTERECLARCEVVERFRRLVGP